MSESILTHIRKALVRSSPSNHRRTVLAFDSKRYHEISDTEENSLAMSTSKMQLGRRCLSFLKVKRRFYKNVHIKEDRGGYVLQLDQRTLKTPLGKPLVIPTKLLAAAVASEWSAQQNTIQGHTMHLTALCNTSIDYPSKETSDSQISQLLKFLHTDTILSRADPSESLADFEREHWDPVLDWFNNRFGVTIKTSLGILTPEQTPDTVNTIEQHLWSLNPWQINGLQTAVDSIKSLIIPMAVMDGTINIDTAVFLARLEVEFQTRRWGKVEWYHDIEAVNQRAQLAAGALFFELCEDLPKIIWNDETKL